MIYIEYDSNKGRHAAEYRGRAGEKVIVKPYGCKQIQITLDQVVRNERSEFLFKNKEV